MQPPVWSENVVTRWVGTVKSATSWPRSLLDRLGGAATESPRRSRNPATRRPLLVHNGQQSIGFYPRQNSKYFCPAQSSNSYLSQWIIALYATLISSKILRGSVARVRRQRLCWFIIGNGVLVLTVVKFKKYLPLQKIARLPCCASYLVEQSPLLKVNSSSNGTVTGTGDRWTNGARWPEVNAICSLESISLPGKDRGASLASVVLCCLPSSFLAYGED
jgi:hypothetical protein